MIGSEKRDRFALNANFYRYSNTHHSDSPLAIGVILGLLALQASYYLLAEGKNGRFRTALSRSRATPIPEVSVAINSPRVLHDV